MERTKRTAKPQTLKEWRKRHRLTQAEVGKLIGVTQRAYGKYEQGRLPKADVLRRVVKLTGLSADTLLGAA